MSILCNLTLLCRLLSIKIKVSGIKCLFKILLVIGYALIMRHRPKTSVRNIWPVASNLTSSVQFDQWLSLCCCVSSYRSWTRVLIGQMKHYNLKTKEKWRFGRYMPNFLKTSVRLLSPRCHLCSVSAIAGCYMKYQILRYFNISCSLGRNDRLSGVGV